MEWRAEASPLMAQFGTHDSLKINTKVRFNLHFLLRALPVYVALREGDTSLFRHCRSFIGGSFTTLSDPHVSLQKFTILSAHCMRPSPLLDTNPSQR